MNVGFLKKMGKMIQNNRSFWLFLIGFCFFLGLFFQLFALHRVEGASMQPMLSTNDFVMVRKKTALRRFDIVSFAPKGQPKESYVKRVIGMPGDRIQVKDSTLYIGINDAAKVESETFSLGATAVMIMSQEAYTQFVSEKEIPAGFYFVLGDNRAQSTDSRSFGFIHESQIEGVAFFRYFPIGKFGLL